MNWLDVILKHPRRLYAAAAAVCVLAALPLCLGPASPLLSPTGAFGGQQERLGAMRESVRHLTEALSRQERRLEDLRKSLQKEKGRLQSAGGLTRRIAKLTDLAAAAGLEVD